MNFKAVYKMNGVRKLVYRSDNRYIGMIFRPCLVCVKLPALRWCNLYIIPKGLVNGAIGEVEDIIKVGGVVKKIRVRFDKDHVEDIGRFSGDYELHPEVYANRTQFPLCLSYAITIHKCQGLTLGDVLIDLGDSIFTDGMAYVALSRVRNLKNIHLLGFSKYAINCNTVAVKEYNRLRVTAGLGQILPYNKRPEQYMAKRPYTKIVEVLYVCAQ